MSFPRQPDAVIFFPGLGLGMTDHRAVARACDIMQPDSRMPAVLPTITPPGLSSLGFGVLHDGQGRAVLDEPGRLKTRFSRESSTRFSGGAGAVHRRVADPPR